MSAAKSKQTNPKKTNEQNKTKAKSKTNPSKQKQKAFRIKTVGRGGGNRMRV